MAKLSIGQYAKILFEATQDLKKEEMLAVVHNFSEFVKKNQMMKKMPYIVDAFLALVKKKEGITDVQVTTAFALQSPLKKIIHDMFGGKVNMHVAEDKSLLGGIILKTENKIFDASVRTQLQKMKETL